MRRDIVTLLAVATLAMGALVVGPVSAVASGSPTPSPTDLDPCPRPSPSTLAPTGSITALSPLVGQWHLAKTCQMIVDALTAAGLTDLIAHNVPDLLIGSVDGAPPADYDPTRPCADALPPIEHSHTFWPDGSFNSYDENGYPVDDAAYTLVDADTFTMSGMTFDFRVQDDAIAFEVVIPDPCMAQTCRDDLGWAFSVANPGQWWTRVMSGPHVP